MLKRYSAKSPHFLHGPGKEDYCYSAFDDQQVLVGMLEVDFSLGGVWRVALVKGSPPDHARSAETVIALQLAWRRTVYNLAQTIGIHSFRITVS